MFSFALEHQNLYYPLVFSRCLFYFYWVLIFFYFFFLFLSFLSSFLSFLAFFRSFILSFFFLSFFLFLPFFFFFCWEVKIGWTMLNVRMMGGEIMGNQWGHLFHRQAFNSPHSFQTPFLVWPWILASSEIGAFLGFCQVHCLVPFCFISWHISNLPEIR